MQAYSSVYRRAARENWPANHPEHRGVVGDGPFAAVCCNFEHPSEKAVYFGMVCLGNTADEAQSMAARWCDARVKGLCRGNHAIYRYDEQAAKWKIFG